MEQGTELSINMWSIKYAAIRPLISRNKKLNLAWVQDDRRLSAGLGQSFIQEDLKAAT
jgi:hypothetical protein